MATPTTTYFDHEDSVHGYAKRVILFRYLEKKFASCLCTAKLSYPYAFTYLDSFSGTGMYGDRTLGGNPVDKSYGSPLIALEALYRVKNRANKNNECLFIFSEVDPERIKKLEENIIKFYDNKNYRILLEDNDLIITDRKLKIRITLVCSKFIEFDFDKYKKYHPMFSFVDPFGFSHTPMSKIVQLIGERKEVLFNFMVEPVNRFLSVSKQDENMSNLFGNANWKDRLPTNYKNLKVPHKVRILLDIYSSRLQSLEIKTYPFSMRRGSATGDNKGYIYYLIFATKELYSIKDMKYAMNVAAQNPSEELYFSDFAATVNEPIWKPLTNFEIECKYIYCNQPFGRNVEFKFGALKQWILLHTPFDTHSKALQELEIQDLLKVLSKDYEFKNANGKIEWKNRRHGKSFPPDVGVELDDPDDDKHKYKNRWVMKFNDDLSDRLVYQLNI